MPQPIPQPLSATQVFFNSAAPEVAALLDMPHQFRRDERLLQEIAIAFRRYNPGAWEECLQSADPTGDPA